MNQEDLPPLQTEVGVLQKIVRVLLQQNDALQAENGRLRQQIAASNTTHSQTDTLSGASKAVHSLTESLQVTNQTTHSPTRLPESERQLLHSLTENLQATNQSIEHHSELSLGMKHATLSNTELSSGMSQETYRLPVRLEASGQNTSGLATILMQAGVGNGKRSTARTAAALIIHFYNEQPGEYKHLKRLVSYSDGGLAKMLMMLRRKGYLIKSGFQQHAVAANGIKALQQAKCK